MIHRLVLFGFLFCLVVLNARVLVAERFAIHARHLLTLENAGEWQDRDVIYARAISNVERAGALQAGSPEYLEIHARLLIQRCKYWDKTSRWDEWRTCQKQALDSIRQSLKINARSPYLWANLLLVKSNLEQFDADFNEALVNARQLGPNELGVNRTVAHVGLLGWLRWQPEQKDLFRQALFTVQAISPKEAKKIAEASEKTALYCFWTRNDPKQFSSCRKKPAKRKLPVVS